MRETIRARSASVITSPLTRAAARTQRTLESWFAERGPWPRNSRRPMLCKQASSVNEHSRPKTLSLDSGLARQCEGNAICDGTALLLDTNFRQAIRCLVLDGSHFFREVERSRQIVERHSRRADRIMVNYLPVLLILIIATGMAAAIIVLSRVAAKSRPTREKLMPYECGVEPVGTARDRQSVKFYLVAMAFLLFDIEAVFLVPWAVVFRGVLHSETYQHLKYVFYGEMMVFMVVLFVGLIYVWRKGILEWNT
jgi:NADH-quinone oxidoreductase subunit A